MGYFSPDWTLWHRIHPSSLGTGTCMWFEEKHTHTHIICTFSEVWFHCTIWHSVPSFGLLHLRCLFKHSPMRCKVRKLLTGTFGRQGSLVYPMAILLEGKVVLCMCAFALCVCVCVCVLGFVSTGDNPKSEKWLLRKTKQNPLFLKIRHMVTEYVSKQ